MEETNIVLEIAEFIIKSIVTPILVTLVTMHIKNKIEKKKCLQENFYHEFYDLYLQTYKGAAYNFTDLRQEEQNEFIEIIDKNDKRVNGLLLQLFYEFRVRTGNKEMYNEKIINNIFNEITDIVFGEIKHNIRIEKSEIRKLKKRLKERQQNEDIYYIKDINKKGFIETYD